MHAHTTSTVFQKHRLEALSDGVFAIVMTLLVLDLKVPHDLGGIGLGTALRADAPAFFSFALTFAIASVFWTLQHRVFEAIRETGNASLILTFGVLGLISLLPFTTSLIGQHGAGALAYELYFADMSLIAALLTLKLEIAHRERRLHENTDTNQLRFRLYRIVAVMLAAAIGAHFVPIVYITVAPLVITFVFKLLRRTRIFGKHA